ncbi:UNVERIFIED_CONTAM: hypothetical protein GTU68_006903 [Idotea baltica]|nr:hypothetical protein [Idotea baltica]
MSRTYRLITACPDKPGIVARLSGLIAEHGGSLTDVSQHSDENTGWFFSRNEVLADSLPFDLDEFKRLLQPIADEFSMEWSIQDSAVKKKVVLMASKQSHCLADLLHRWHSGELDCDIACVISNHLDLREMVEWHNLPFYQVFVSPNNRENAFDEIESLIGKHQADTVVLARYMQILPPSLCEKLNGQIINIHHSFLPSFAGAKPYHQAAERGVKLIGATCHYVTEDLDEGPIIEQDVVRITHRDGIEDMVRKGKDCEVQVLARGLRAHLADRVIIRGNKTVVFD